MNFSFTKKVLFPILLLLSFYNSFAQTYFLSKDARVSVITCGTGNESYSLFGHTAIRISDAQSNLDVVYNYGAFDFDTPNFVAKFAKGDLQYFAVANSYADFIAQYVYEKRAVYEQELIIPLQLKQKLFDHLNNSLLSEERYYTYKFIDKNCTSMVVEVLNKTLGGDIIRKTTDTDVTYRNILYPYFENNFYYKLGTSIIFGTKVDQMGDRIFLPMELLESLKTTRFQNHLICKPTQTILDFPKEVPHSWWNNIYSYIVLLGLFVFINNKKTDLFYFLVLGLFGLFFITMGFYSFHRELEYNYNVLLFNPFLLFLFYFICTKNKKWTRNLVIFNLASLVIYLIFIANKAYVLIMLPLIITSGILLVRCLKRNK